MCTKSVYKLPKNILLEHNLQTFKMKLNENLIGVDLYSTEELFFQMYNQVLFLK